MKLLLVAGLLLAGCSPDPIVGTWSADGKAVEFHDDGTMSGVEHDDPDCAGETAARTACTRRTHWERSGSTYHLTMMSLSPRSAGGMGGLFAASRSPDGSRCECTVSITADAKLEGDELVIDGGKERAHRVK